MRGCYEALSGGKLQDALVDMTGGLGEMISIADKSEIPDNLYDLMWKCSQMNSMLGASIHVGTGPGRVAQSVTCLVIDAKLTADPGVASSIPARSHTFVEIDHEIISTVIFLPSAESFMKGCCQLQAKVCARLLVN